MLVETCFNYQRIQNNRITQINFSLMQDKQQKYKRSQTIKKLNLEDSEEDDQISQQQSSEISHLKHNLYEANMKVLELSSNMNHYLLEREQQSKKYKDLQISFKQQISFLKQDKKQLQKQKQFYKKQLSKVTEHNKIQVEQLKQQLNAFVSQNRLTPNFNSVSKQLGQTQLITELLKKDQTIKAMHKQNTILKQLVEKSVNRSSSQSFGKNNQQSVVQQTQKIKTEQANIKLRQCSQKLKQQENKNKQLNLKIQSKINNNLKLQKQNDEYQIKITNLSIQRTQKYNQIEHTKKQMSYLTKQMTLKIKNIEDLKQNNFTLNKSLKILQKQLDQKRQQFNKFQQKYILLLEQNKNYKHENQRILCNQKQLKIKLYNIQQPQSKLKQINLTLRSKDVEIKQLTKKINDLMSNQTILTNQIAKRQSKITEQQCSLRELANKIQILNNQNSERINQNTSLKTQINQLQNRKNQLKQQKKRIGEQAHRIMSRLKEQGNKYKIKWEQSSQKMRELNKQIQSYQNKLQKTDSQKKEYQKNNQLLAHKYDLIQCQLQKIREENEKLSIKLTQFDQNNKKLENKTEQSFQNQYIKLKQYCEKILSQYGQLNEQNQQIKLQNQRLSSMITNQNKLKQSQNIVMQQIQVAFKKQQAQMVQQVEQGENKIKQNQLDKNQIQKIKQQYLNLNSQRYALQDKISVLKQEKQFYKQQTQSLALKLNQLLQNQNINTKINDTSQHQKEVILLRRQIYKLTNQIDNFKNSNNRITSLSNFSSPQKKNLRDSLDSYHNNSHDLTNFQEQIAHLKYQIELMKLQKQENYKKIKQLQMMNHKHQSADISKNINNFDSLRVSGGKSFRNQTQIENQRLKSLLQHRQNLIQKLSNKLNQQQQQKQYLKQQLSEQSNRLRLQLNLLHDQKKQLFEEIGNLQQIIKKYQIERQKQSNQIYDQIKKETQQRLQFLGVQVSMIKKQRDKTKQQKIQIQQKLQNEIQMRQKRYAEQRSKLVNLIEQFQNKQKVLHQKILQMNKLKHEQLNLKKQSNQQMHAKEQEYFQIKYLYFQTLEQLNKTLKKCQNIQNQRCHKHAQTLKKCSQLVLQNQHIKRQVKYFKQKILIGNIKNQQTLLQNQYSKALKPEAHVNKHKMFQTDNVLQANKKSKFTQNHFYEENNQILDEQYRLTKKSSVIRKQSQDIYRLSPFQIYNQQRFQRKQDDFNKCDLTHVNSSETMKIQLTDNSYFISQNKHLINPKGYNYKQKEEFRNPYLFKL